LRSRTQSTNGPNGVVAIEDRIDDQLAEAGNAEHPYTKKLLAAVPVPDPSLAASPGT
jgi:ABC-type oligopeptide transport system ATPase subunit